MNCRFFAILGTLLLAATEPPTAAEAPYGHRDFVPTPERPVGFRGDGSGHFPGAMPALTFSEKDGKNVLWSIKMPNWSQSSPILVGKHVITAAEPDTTLCVDADAGKVLWQDALGLFPKLTLDPKNPKESNKYAFLWCGHGYSWPCSDGERVCQSWNSGKTKTETAAALVCYDLQSGKRLWLCQFTGSVRGEWKPLQNGVGLEPGAYGPSGYASPRIQGDLVIYHAKQQQCRLVALDKLTGALRWQSQPSVFGVSGSDANFLILRVASRDVLITNIGTVLDPKTGAVLGEAIPGIEKDGKRFSRLWGLVESQKGEVKVAGVAPITAPGAAGLVAFGSDWGRAGAGDCWDAVPSASKGSDCCYLAVRLGFDAQGKVVSTVVFPERVLVPKLEYGNGHLTMVRDRLLVIPGYGSSLAAIALDMTLHYQRVTADCRLALSVAPGTDGTYKGHYGDYEVQGKVTCEAVTPPDLSRPCETTLMINNALNMPGMGPGAPRGCFNASWREGQVLTAHLGDTYGYNLWLATVDAGGLVLRDGKLTGKLLGHVTSTYQDKYAGECEWTLDALVIGRRMLGNCTGKKTGGKGKADEFAIAVNGVIANSADVPDVKAWWLDHDNRARAAAGEESYWHGRNPGKATPDTDPAKKPQGGAP